MLARAKTLIKRVPIVGPFLVHLRRRQFNSAGYWEQRYRNGGNSGAGSRNRLAEFKADFLNRFVEEHSITSVIEYGSGDGAHLKLAKYPTYTGVDVSARALEICRTLFAEDTPKRFVQPDALPRGTTAELSLSLDVIYHLVEDDFFDAHMRRLFDSATRFVVVYSSDMELLWPDKHVRHRRYTHWVWRNKPEWRLQSVVKNAYPYDAANPEQTSFADFRVFSRLS